MQKVRVSIISKEQFEVVEMLSAKAFSKVGKHWLIIRMEFIIKKTSSDWPTYFRISFLRRIDDTHEIV